MTRDEKRILLVELTDAHKKFWATVRQLDALFDSAAGSLFDNWCAALNLSTKTVSRLICDDWEWVEWWVQECNCGDKERSAVVNGIERTVRTADDLLDVIETENNNDAV